MKNSRRPAAPITLTMAAGLGLAFWGCAPERPAEPGPGGGRPPAESRVSPLEALGAAPAPRREEPPVGPLSLRVQQAVLMALEGNPGFRIERLRPAISRTGERSARAAFDPTLSAGGELGRSRDDSDSGETTSDSASVDAAIGAYLPTGTTVEAGGGYGVNSTENGTDTEGRTLSWDVSVTQALLRGRGLAANLVSLRQARLDTQISLHELRGAAEALVAQVEAAYWDHVLAERSIAIYEKSLQVANQSIDEVRERVRVGKVAETELAAAEAELASRQEQLITARGTLAKRKIALLKLLTPPGGESVWTRELGTAEAPETPAVRMDEAAAHVKLAMAERPDLSQARLEVQRGDLEVVRTRNGLLPKLDLFVRLGGSRYANSFSPGDDEDGDDVSATVGLNFELPLGRRDAKARHERATLSAEQARAALVNMEQLVQVDVRSAYVDVESAAERVKATAATRKLRERTLEIEQEKFRVGKSTTLLVAQAARDVLASQISEVETVVAYRKALTSLFRLEGSLLARRGIKY